MGWLGNKVLGWSTNVQKRELAEFVARLRAMDGSELGMVVACATNHRHLVAKTRGWNLLEPALCEMQEPALALKIGQLIKDLQAKNRPELAVGFFVWLHSVRAANNPDLRQLGRDMWNELGRGFKHVEDSAEGFETVTGFEFNTAGYDAYPAGLTPSPV
ncbi:hypothetical protein [Mesorhizobium sp.]|uniref:hypothetical protein n=1 Tax=Mesorhizobium sp. TaxID=1871066 RepID=UPI000FE68D7C|nr:hypothetical protein [Mesorhizobium sp.]RWE67258.1 MAG: hypothetical protein EOS62_15800 [Mesorhizobium sp.]RWE98440.1 MAG: hypothetical protein EOS43_18000 [Mesorhizobium sp.]